MAAKQRMCVKIRGVVQGVGFRPFVYRLATHMGLMGWVNNSPQGVLIEVEGRRSVIDTFVRRIVSEQPPLARIEHLETAWLPPNGYTEFRIQSSDNTGIRTTRILPDISTCPDCRREILDPADRRYRYPFTNCTHCGPRFSIIETLPYDRQNTSMKRFIMCPRCEAEYEDPLNRRFHAQPNACPDCGPQLEAWDRLGERKALRDDALLMAVRAIRAGAIVAVKGLGGFHLMVDARNQEAVQRLRRRKRRRAKPLALMLPSLALVREHLAISPLEEKLLCSPEAPIVLLDRKDAADEIALAVAPGNPCLGVMLPYTPLHQLLLDDLGFPVVATSGNLSDEPICIDEGEALGRLGKIADLFLVHNRPIVRHVDDSVVRVLAGREAILRRARGYAPLPIPVHTEQPTVLAVGAHQKNTTAIPVGRNVFISQHIGDLESMEANIAFRQTIESFQTLYQLQPSVIACDAHPDYASTHFANDSGLPTIQVQHHYAHVLACMAENGLEGSVLGIAWDGSGYGTDGTIWGGEFLHISHRSWKRVAHLRTFPLPGGERAIREPRRAALGLLYALYGDELFAMQPCPALDVFLPHERVILQTMLRQHVNSPLTSSVGRLFDAIASLVELRQHVSFEGQAAMELEFALTHVVPDLCYHFTLHEDGNSPIVVDWEPLMRAMLDDIRQETPIGTIAAKFHNTLVNVIVAVARKTGEEQIVLTGGCFQNRYLTERAIQHLTEEGYRPYWHRQIPPNDGGISLGQIIAASWELQERSACV